MFGLDFSFSGEGFVGININWKGFNSYLVNIYSLCMLLNNMICWKRLIDFKSKFHMGEGCICGDFNAVKKKRGKQMSE